jgi:hypothetical protein
MKTKQPDSVIFTALLIAVSAILALAGCATLESDNTESLLVAAGFRVRTPETVEQKQIYASLPPYQMQRATAKDGRVFYVFKDEKKAVAYVGREPEYQRYRQLAVEQRIAENNYMAAEMNREAAWGWYGAWGPRRIWW